MLHASKIISTLAVNQRGDSVNCETEQTMLDKLTGLHPHTHREAYI